MPANSSSSLPSRRFEIRRFPPASRFRAQCEMGRLCQSAFRRTSASGGLRRPLHAPGRDFQSSDRGYRRRAGQVQLARLPRQQSAENYDSAEEFIRRFLLHVLPSGLHRIRYYGFLGNRYRKET